MAQYLLYVFKTEVGIFLQHSMQKFLQIFGKVSIWGKLQLLVEYVAKKFVLVSRVVGGQSQQQLVQQCTQTVIVNFKTVTLPT